MIYFEIEFNCELIKVFHLIIADTAFQETVSIRKSPSNLIRIHREFKIRSIWFYGFGSLCSVTTSESSVQKKNLI